MSRKNLAYTLGVVAVVLAVAWGAHGGEAVLPVVGAQTDTWTTEVARKYGVRLLETRDPRGPAAYPVNAGDLLFFTNTGTSYGAKNTRNAVVVLNARTRKPIAVSEVEAAWSEGFVSHGIGVSPDAKYVYLPAIAPRNAANPGSVLVLDARTLKIAQVITSAGQAPHHVKMFEDANGRARMLVEEFNWHGSGGGALISKSDVGQGFYVLDPRDNNKVVAGMAIGEVRGTIYTCFGAPGGGYLYCSVPGPDMRNSIRGRGYLAEIDTQSWKLVESLPMGAYPLWTVFTQDGNWAWITNSGESKVFKIQRATGPGQADKVVAEVPTGGGPYGLRMSIDDREVWVADKGEGQATRGSTITVIDAERNQVKQTIKTGCILNDHVILSPDGREMWATCNESHEVIVIDARTYEIQARIPMPNQGDSHGGSFVSYSAGPGGVGGETVSDTSGLHGSALDAARRKVPWSAQNAR